MKKVFSLLVTGFLLVGNFGCQEAPTSTSGSDQVPAKQASEMTKSTGKTIKSTVKETPIPAINGNNKDKTVTDKTLATKTEGDIKALVTNKLQAGIPGNKLVVENQQGEITIKGIASSQQELEKAEKLVREVKGVKTVKVEAKVEPSNRS
jgi:hyperosmotically inducible periplasmic protein